jgi:hypothetical protein
MPRLLIVRPQSSPRFGDGAVLDLPGLSQSKRRQSRRQARADALGVTLTLSRRANEATIARTLRSIGSA